MVRVAAHNNGFTPADANKHSASDRTVTAGGLYPLFGDARCGDKACFRIVPIGVLALKRVQAKCPAETCECAHSHPPRTKVRAMLSGTTETKQRWRESSTPEIAEAEAAIYAWLPANSI